ncbi:MAG: glycosyltransferase [Bacteroidetes bacterium]|nr:glycosyltransferase [Bacteroidota bacterium]
MEKSKQIFQTHSKLRWNTFKWVGRFLLFLFLLTIPIVWIAMSRTSKILLPGLSKYESVENLNPTIARGLSKQEQKKYHGYRDLLVAKKKDKLQVGQTGKSGASSVRAGFYVDWDPQAYTSLQSHIGDMNMVIPEWFFIDPVTDTLVMDDEITDAYNLMKKSGVKIVPILNNVNLSRSSEFDPTILEAVLKNPTKREKLLNDIETKLTQYGLQGINIDFEEINEGLKKPVIAFQQELYKRLHAKGLLVTQDVPTDDDTYDLKKLSDCNDYIFLMAYDQHHATSNAGPVSAQQWIEKELDIVAKDIPSSKIILAIAGYGYDWPDKHTATSVSYQEAIANAKEFNATIDFDNDSYNCTYEYTDYDKIHHTVYFMDAASNFNTMRFADEYGTGGVALWRLGTEDERLWTFYNRDLSNAAIAANPFNYSSLATLDIIAEKPHYIDDGEILNVISSPQKGIIDIDTSNNEQLISEETYRQLPTQYVIRRSGEVNNQVILTFDDGPDPVYTPQILDILEKEKVPATFFIVGINGEQHLPILKRIYRDGFELGNHSFTHPNIAAISPIRAQTELEATRLLIESATGRSTILFRAPYNADAEPTKAEELVPIARAQQSSYYTVGESIDPEDWDIEDGVNADTIYNRVVQQYEQRDGTKGIILFHDAGGDRSATVKALPRIIEYFKKKGVEFTTVANLLHFSKDAVMPPVHSNILSMNSVVITFFYWLFQILAAAFWVAIILGFLKILLMGCLAVFNYFKRKKELLLLKEFSNGKVSIIVPAYNEEINAVNTVKSLLMQDYKNFEIIFVDDGSSDGTFTKVSTAFSGTNNVSVYTKYNGGKASALNFGIGKATGQYVICIDADTHLMPDAVSKMMKYFADTKVVAVAGYVQVGNDKNMITKWQDIEYITAQNFDRFAFDHINCITVVPGAIGAFNKEAVLAVGGFTTDTLAEDCDLTIRLLKNGGVIRNCSEAVAVTEAPETLRQFMKQRFRWTYGIMQSFWKNKEACFNPSYGTLGMVALPNILIFQIILPFIAPIADLLFVFSLIWSWHDPDSLHRIFLFYGIFFLVDMGVSVMAFIFQKEKFSKLLWLIPQRFIYRQLMYIVLFRSIRKAIKGEGQGWGVLKRTGNVKFNEKKLEA